jgi:hypothetical protein
MHEHCGNKLSKACGFFSACRVRDAAFDLHRSRRVFAARQIYLTLLALAPLCLVAQDEPAPPVQKPGVRITFLPPPMEGTLSLGVYDKRGKLVRILEREAEAEKRFTIGLNGLITTWDGKDDAGQPLPAAKYSVRGYAVGEVQIEGVAMHCNDWITDDDSPRVAKMVSLSPSAGVVPSDLGINVVLASGVTGTVSILPDGKIRTFQPREKVPREDLPIEWPHDSIHHDRSVGEAKYGIRDGQLVKANDAGEWQQLKLPGLTHALFFVPDGRQDGVNEFWIIDETTQGREVKFFTEQGEFKRRLVSAPGEPQAFALSTNSDSTALRLLEQKPDMQRLRILQRARAAAATAPDQTTDSLWETVASIEIANTDTFAAVAAKLGRTKPFVPEENIRVHLLPNELFKGATTEVNVQIAIDGKGAYLKTADGLPLLQITETPNLKWAVMGREGAKVITVFQSDGAVVEEFKARKLANMMAFDAGEYEWTGK